MTAVPDRRIILQQEEVKYRSSVSEATLTRVAATTNHINNRQMDSKSFVLNGPYDQGGAMQTGVDGAWIVPVDMTITKISMYVLEAGTSGTTTFDVRRFTDANTPVGGATIFGTKPSIDFSAGDNVWLTYDFLNSVIIKNPTGTTIPTLVIPDLYEGEMVYLNFDSKQVGSKNCGLIISYRPI